MLQVDQIITLSQVIKNKRPDSLGRIVCCQFVQDQVKLVRDSIGDETLRFRCLPKKLNLLSACSGTGLFELCTRALMKEINPEACVLSVQIFHAVKPS